MVQRRITEADTLTIWLGTTPSGLTSDPRSTSSPPPLFPRMPYLPQSSHFILACNRHQMCWFAYPVAWLSPNEQCNKYHRHQTGLTFPSSTTGLFRKGAMLPQRGRYETLNFSFLDITLYCRRSIFPQVLLCQNSY